MIDARRLQRALFRVQLDPELARRVFGREPEALESLRLDELALAWLLDADPRAIAADRGGRRREQLVGNLATEFPRSAWALDRAPTGFLSTTEFHRAIDRDEPLPIAFGRWLREVTATGSDELRAFVSLEATMAEARRALRAVPELAPGEVALAATCRLVRTPEGTHSRATEVGLALESGTIPSAVTGLGGGEEVLLVQAGAEPRYGGRREVRVERLEPPVARLLKRSETPLDREARREFAKLEGADAGELEAFAAGLVADGILTLQS